MSAETIPLQPVDTITVTTLVDNVADLLLPDEGPAKRYGLAQAVEPGVPARFLAGGLTGDPLRAEHGFSCLVTVGNTSVLFDAGLTPDGLVETNVPVLIHPEFWSRRRVAIPSAPVELPSTSKPALEGAGFEIVENRQPSFLLDGSLLVTGEVDRTTEFEQGAGRASWSSRAAATRAS